MEAGVGAIVGRVSSEDVSLGLRELDARARKTTRARVRPPRSYLLLPNPKKKKGKNSAIVGAS
jgi:hypothetical protein